MLQDILPTPSEKLQCLTWEKPHGQWAELVNNQGTSLPTTAVERRKKQRENTKIREPSRPKP